MISLSFVLREVVALGKKHNFYIFFFVFCSISVHAEYFCEIQGFDPASGQLKKSSFTMPAYKERLAKNLKFLGLKAQLQYGIRDIRVNLSNPKVKLSQERRIDLAAPKFVVKLHKMGQVSCSKEKEQAKKVAKVLKDSSDLTEFKNGFKLILTKDHKFIYNQDTTLEGMRRIIFQEGVATYNLDQKKDGVNFCIFQIRLGLDQDTTIPKGRELLIDKVQQFSNNPQTKVISFIFNQQKDASGISYNSYVPFLFECRIKQEEVLSYKSWLAITGNGLKINL